MSFVNTVVQGVTGFIEGVSSTISGRAELTNRYIFKREATKEAINSSNLSECVDNNKLTTTVKPFEVYSTIIRAANTTAYAAGQLISGVQLSGSTITYDGSTLIPIELAAVGAIAGQSVQITQLSVISNQNPATSVLIPKVQLFKHPLSGLSDAMAFAPTFASLGNYFQANFSDLSTTENAGTNGYQVLGYDYTKLVTLRNDEGNPTQARIYVALIAQNAYTPKSSEGIVIKIKGFLL